MSKTILQRTLTMYIQKFKLLCELYVYILRKNEKFNYEKQRKLKKIIQIMFCKHFKLIGLFFLIYSSNILIQIN